MLLIKYNDNFVIGTFLKCNSKISDVKFIDNPGVFTEDE